MSAVALEVNYATDITFCGTCRLACARAVVMQSILNMLLHICKNIISESRSISTSTSYWTFENTTIVLPMRAVHTMQSLVEGRLMPSKLYSTQHTFA